MNNMFIYTEEISTEVKIISLDDLKEQGQIIEKINGNIDKSCAISEVYYNNRDLQKYYVPEQIYNV